MPASSVANNTKQAEAAVLGGRGKRNTAGPRLETVHGGSSNLKQKDEEARPKEADRMLNLNRDAREKKKMGKGKGCGDKRKKNISGVKCVPGKHQLMIFSTNSCVKAPGSER